MNEKGEVERGDSNSLYNEGFSSFTFNTHVFSYVVYSELTFYASDNICKFN